MKNILKYAAAAVALVASLAGCQEFQDYTQTVDGSSKLVYVKTGTGNTFSTKIAHRPTGSTGSFATKFVVRCNAPVHGPATVTLAYDASLVESYNAGNKTAYAVLPEGYLEMENTTLALAANAVQTADTVKLRLAPEADLSLLTEQYYLAPLRLAASGIGASEDFGAVYLLVETEINLIRPITTIDDMAGFSAGDRYKYTADCGNFANLFDGNAATSATFARNNNVLIVDMKDTHMVTGLCFNGGRLSTLSIEYSLDGKSWAQGGTPVAGEYVTTGSTQSGAFYTALYDYIEARFLRLSFGFSSTTVTINELDIYQIEGAAPTIYAQTGANNVVTGKIVHKKGVGSSSTFAASFKAYTTTASASGYTVTAAADNSLVAAYNEAHGTTYAQLPAANLNIESASVAIAADAKASTDELKISLKGDLSALTAKQGYLIPVKLATAAGAVVSQSRGVVYAVISIENNLIRGIKSVNDMVGFPAGGSSSWSADCGASENLFDGNTSTAVTGLVQSGNVMTVDMKSAQMVTGIHFYTYNFSTLSIEYSVDGSVWETAGTVATGENVFTGSSSQRGDYYVAFVDYFDARYLRFSFGFTSSYRVGINEMAVYQIESTDPTIYAQCGADNVLTGTITHHSIAGTMPAVNAAFNVMTTVSAVGGYSVGAAIDNALISAYNSTHGTSYAAIDPSLVKLENAPCAIAGGANASADQIKVSLTGNLTGLTNKGGYLIPVKLSAPAGAVVSESRGVVYVAVSVEMSSELFRKNFTVSDIAGAPVADRSAWTILACDQEGVHSGSYPELFDGNGATYVRTWGGPVSFTVDLGKEYDMTGLMFGSRTDYGSKYAPSEVMIECSLDGGDYEAFGTPTQAAGNIYRASSTVPESYIALYGSKKVRYLKINASYGSNMGTAEFNIYAK